MARVKSGLLTLHLDERGDVPGWVLIVLMTSSLVLGIWAIAEDQLTNIVKNALDTVCGSRC